MICSSVKRFFMDSPGLARGRELTILMLTRSVSGQPRQHETAKQGALLCHAELGTRRNLGLEAQAHGGLVEPSLEVPSGNSIAAIRLGRESVAGRIAGVPDRDEGCQSHDVGA